VRAVLIACALASTARADSLYIIEEFGVATARGALSPYVGTGLYTRLAGGMHLGPLFVEPWLAGALQTSRDGSTLYLFGGEPKSGKSDLQMFGLDFKVAVPIAWKLEGFARGGPEAVSADGALADYIGHGFGASAGLSLKGRVRALGFLWTPLFFAGRGPLADATLFLEEGVDWLSMSNGATRIEGRVGHTSIGFSVSMPF
jgi:hypothetical protein